MTSSIFASSLNDTVVVSDVQTEDEQVYFTFLSEDGAELETVPLVKLDYIEELEAKNELLRGYSLPTSYWNISNSACWDTFGTNSSNRVDYSNYYYSPNANNKIYLTCDDSGYADEGLTVTWSIYRYYPNTKTKKYIGSTNFNKIPGSLNGLYLNGVASGLVDGAFYCMAFSQEQYWGKASGEYKVHK